MTGHPRADLGEGDALVGRAATEQHHQAVRAHRMVDGGQPWVSLSSLARAAAARTAGLPDPSAGCCQRGDGAAPFLRR